MVYNEALRTTYGYIVRSETFDAIDTADALITAAVERLAEGAGRFKTSVTVSAIDLYGADSAYPFRVGRLVKLTSTPHGVEGVGYVLQALDLDIVDPSRTSLDLGAVVASQTDATLTERRETAREREVIRATLDKAVTSLGDTLDRQLTEVRQDAGSIVATALAGYVKQKDIDTYKAQVSTRFEQTANEFGFLFEESERGIDAVSGQLTDELNERKSFIRFVDGNIVLGKDENPVTLKIENDRISFWQSDTEVAYLTDNQLFITNAQLLTTLRIGDFAFTPGYGGNLSFRRAMV